MVWRYSLFLKNGKNITCFIGFVSPNGYALCRRLFSQKYFTNSFVSTEFILKKKLPFRCITDLSQCSNGYTLVMWLKLGRTTVGFLVNSGGQTIRVKTGGIVLAHKSDGTITVAVRLREGDQAKVWLGENIQAPQEEWFHIGVTWRKNGQLKVYINGNLTTTVSEGTFTPEADDVDSTMHLGKLRQSDHYHANATMDDLTIWEQEKSETEVRKLTSGEC